MNTKKMNLLTDSTKAVFLRYLIPSTGSSLVTSVYILVDTIMIGRGIGAIGIVALNIVLPIFFLFFGTGLLFGVGGSVLMSFSFGKNDFEIGKQYFTLAVLANTVLAVLYWIVFGLFFDKIMFFLGATNNSYIYIYEYGNIIVMGAPVFMFSTLLQAFIRNDRDPKTAMYAVIAGGVSNIILDYIFIFIMHMGMRGGAIATVIGSAITVIILLTHFFSKYNILHIQFENLDFSQLRKIMTNGFSSFFVEMAGGIVIFIFNIQAIRYAGELGVTVYGILSNSAIIVMSLANGIGQAAQPIIAINYGANKTSRVMSVLRYSIITSLIVGIVIIFIGEVFPSIVADIFVKSDAAILKMGIPAIRIYFVSFILAMINILFSNYYQAVMQAQKAMLISLLRGLIIISALVIILPLFYGVNGIWASALISEALTTIFIIINFLKNMRRL